jgi:hypothetical protein
MKMSNHTDKEYKGKNMATGTKNELLTWFSVCQVMKRKMGVRKDYNSIIIMAVIGIEKAYDSAN